MTEERLYRALALAIGARFVTSVPGVPFGEYRREAIVTGCVRVVGSGAGPQAVLIAPEGEGFERMVRSGRGSWRTGSGLMVTTPRVLRAWALASHAEVLKEDASYRLKASMPDMSSCKVASPTQIFLAAAVAAGVPFALTLDWIWYSHLLCLLLSPIFAIAAATRIVCALRAPSAPVTASGGGHIADDRLPPYTILCALYREASVVPHLVRAISAIDYPALGSKLTKERVAAIGLQNAI